MGGKPSRSVKKSVNAQKKSNVANWEYAYHDCEPPEDDSDGPDDGKEEEDDDDLSEEFLLEAGGVEFYDEGGKGDVVQVASKEPEADFVDGWMMRRKAFDWLKDNGLGDYIVKLGEAKYTTMKKLRLLGNNDRMLTKIFGESGDKDLFASEIAST
jgi:hypothetical protein